MRAAAAREVRREGGGCEGGGGEGREKCTRVLAHLPGASRGGDHGAVSAEAVIASPENEPNSVAKISRWMSFDKSGLGESNPTT